MFSFGLVVNEVLKEKELLFFCILSLNKNFWLDKHNNKIINKIT